MRTLSDVLSHFHPSKRHGKSWRTVCPAHSDAPSHPSLEITEGHTGILFCCQSKGCHVSEILAAVGLVWDDVLPPRGLPPDEADDFAAVYDYRDIHGALQYQVLRKDTKPGAPKQFLQRHPVNGGWSWKRNGIPPVPYRLHELVGQTRVFVVEGEKDADRLWSLGLPATCNSGGAGKWSDADSAALKAAGMQQCVLLPDNDGAGLAHVQSVGKSLAALGLIVYTLAPFPVPTKGDVSDWLDAGHTIDELEVLVRAKMPPKPLAKLEGLHTMLQEPEDITAWVVADRIPAGSVCLLVAKPKVGKTTAARHLAVAIARGESWLGSDCEQGIVWYMAFEGRKADHLAHFRQFALTEDEAARIWCYMESPTPTVMTEMRARAITERPVLIIIDTLQRLLQVKSMDDYAEVTKAFDGLISLARDSGAALLLLHHAGKAMDREALDSVLGSTAIAGSVDNTFVLAKLAGFRTVTTRQRVGPDLDECVIKLLESGRVILGGSREIAEREVLMKKLYGALSNADNPLLHADVLELVEGRRQAKILALRQLVTDGTLKCTGTGKKTNPFIYSVPAVPAVPAVPEPWERNPEDTMEFD